MLDYELKNIDSEDINDFIVKVEKSFEIKFIGDELVHITTFGQLCDHIVNKIQLDNSNDCTSQQAFYKLRDAISSVLQIDNKLISTDFLLDELLPSESRRSQTKKIEQHLGFKLNILRPSHWLTRTLFILLLASTIGFFIKWPVGLIGIMISTLALWFSNIFGNEFDLLTVGQVAEKMKRENYLKSRRNPNTLNKSEVEKLLKDWFIDDLNLDINKLT